MKLFNYRNSDKGRLRAGTIFFFFRRRRIRLLSCWGEKCSGLDGPRPAKTNEPRPTFSLTDGKFAAFGKNNRSPCLAKKSLGDYAAVIRNRYFFKLLDNLRCDLRMKRLLHRTNSLGFGSNRNLRKEKLIKNKISSHHNYWFK